MSQTVARPMSVDEFFAWQEKQDVRYELVNGQPVPVHRDHTPRAMAGASNAHDQVVVNLISALRPQLRGTGCTPFSGDGSIETYPGQIRRPDVGVDCGRRDPDGYTANEPRIVFEVLSRSTRTMDVLQKLEEYKSLASIHTIVFVEPRWASVTVSSRTDDGWRVSEYTDLRDEIRFRNPDVALSLSLVYEDVEFPTEPS